MGLDRELTPLLRGSINPSTGVYLVFDARSGRELHEFIGDHFVWSPDASRVASLGNVPHFSALEAKADSLEIDGTRVYPLLNDRERHWFRSEPTWSANSRSVAIVDHRQTDGSLWLIVASADGHYSDYKLPWQIPLGEWPPERDVSIRWDRPRIVVQYAGRTQVVSVSAGARK